MNAKVSALVSVFLFKVPAHGEPDSFATGSIEQLDQYANRIPNPKHTPKYTKAKVLHTQDKHVSAEQLCRATLPLPLPYKKPCCY